MQKYFSFLQVTELGFHLFLALKFKWTIGYRKSDQVVIDTIKAPIYEVKVDTVIPRVTQKTFLPFTHFL